jgi:excinuclease ABC subunit A
MQFLSDLYVRCAECEGKRFQPHVLKIKMHDKSIHDVLELTVSEAIHFFARIGEQKTLSDPLEVLDEVGLGYLRLGQPLNTLSGGESQRLKLVRHLANMEGHAPSCPKNGADSAAPSSAAERRGNLFIFDEPTTGLHFDDVAMLLQVFQRLVERGNSLIVIEHNLEVIKSADWIVDLGPEAGDEGGEVVGVGTPEQLAKIENSHTGRFLRKGLGSARASRAVRGALAANALPSGS